MSPEVRFARNGEIRIAYSVVGEGSIDFLYLASFTNLDLIWENALYTRFLQSIASFSRLILVDRRGQGVSDRLSPEDIPLLEDNVDDVIAVLDATGSQRTVLMGLSDLGVLCTMLASSHPDRIAGLILFGATACGVQAPDYPWQWTEDIWAGYLADVKENWGTHEFAERNLALFAPSLVGQPEQLDWFERFQRGTASANVELAVESVFRQADVRSVLHAIRVPTLLLHRTGDRIEDVEGSRYIADAISGARFVELEGADHFVWAGDQEPVLREIERFVGSLGDEIANATANRVLATVMFTDIVGSTEHAAAVGDTEWRRLLDSHDRVARAEIERHRGTMVKSLGDGVLATFDGPGRAVRCGESIGRAVEALGLRVRVGVHCGEVEVMKDDVGGIAVHTAARIAAIAGPGEVLVSSTVKALVSGSSLQFTDRGTQELKCIPEPWHLFALLA